VWNVQTGQVAFTGQGRNVFSVAFSPDGQYLAGARFPDAIRVWNLRTGDESFALEGFYHSVMFSPDGKRIAAAGGNGTIKLWEAQGGVETISLPPLQGQQAMAVPFSFDDQRLAGAGLNGTVRIWDTGLR
jgi:WD40 repeat protein